MKFAALILLLCSSMAFASGKLMLEPYRDMTTEQNGVKVGLSVYKHLWGKAYLNSYSGFGMIQNEGVFDAAHTDNWVMLKNGIAIKCTPKLETEVGVAFRKHKDADTMKWDVWDKQVYVRASYELWK